MTVVGAAPAPSTTATCGRLADIHVGEAKLTASARVTSMSRSLLKFGDDPELHLSLRFNLDREAARAQRL
jgi:hypothetical protein